MIRFENWKNGRWIVERNSEGKRTTWRKQKGSGIKTLVEAKEIFDLTGTFRKDTIKINEKTVKTRQKIYSRTRIGKNTIIVRSNKTLKSETHYQYFAMIYWGKERRRTTGWSNIRGSLKQAIERSIQQAIRDRIITYEYRVDVQNGTAYPPNPKQKPIKFEVRHEVATYVKAKGQFSER